MTGPGAPAPLPPALPPTGIVPPVPDPATLDPLIETWAAGELMFRGHALGTDPRRFNPGFGSPTRFAFFADSVTGSTVPVFYAGSTVKVAVAERLFHDLPLGPGSTLVFPQYCDVAYSKLAPRRPLRLGALHSDGLRRLGLRNHQICETDAVEYPDTARWAAALHSRMDISLDGLVWMSRQFNSEKAVVLFGDRVKLTDFDVDTQENDIPFAKGKGLGTLLIAADEAGILVQTPPAPFLT